MMSTLCTVNCIYSTQEVLLLGHVIVRCILAKLYMKSKSRQCYFVLFHYLVSSKTDQLFLEAGISLEIFNIIVIFCYFDIHHFI